MGSYTRHVSCHRNVSPEKNKNNNCLAQCIVTNFTLKFKYTELHNIA